MTQDQIPGDNFDERVLALLKTAVTERDAIEGTPATLKPAWRRRAPRLAVAGVAVAAIAAAVLVVNAGGGDTSAAFAVEARPEGIVSVEVNSLEDPKGLEEALEEIGVPASVNYLAAGMACKEPRFRPAASTGAPLRLLYAAGSMRGEGPGEGPPFVVSGPLTISFNRDAIAPGQTLVITASAADDGEGFEGSRGFFAPGSRVELAEGTVAPCESVPAPPDGEGAGR